MHTNRIIYAQILIIWSLDVPVKHHILTTIKTRIWINASSFYSSCMFFGVSHLGSGQTAKFKVQSRVRTGEDEKTKKERAVDYWKSMTCHSEVPLIGPVLKVAFTTWLMDRQFIFANEGIDHVGKVFEQAQQTHCADLQLGQGNCQLSAFSVWQDIQLQMPGKSLVGGRGGQNVRDRRGKIKKAEWQIGRGHIRIKEERENASSAEQESPFTCKTGCQMLVWFSTCVAISTQSLGCGRQMIQWALLYFNKPDKLT